MSLSAMTPATSVAYFIGVASVATIAWFLTFIKHRTSSSYQKVPHIWSAWYFGPPQWILSSYQFVYESVRQYGGIFKFKFRNTDVYFVSGRAWRKSVFFNRKLDLHQGIKLIHVNAKDIVHPNGEDKSTSAWIAKFMGRSTRLQEALPELITEINRHFREMPSSGDVEIFENLQVLVFRLIVHLFGPIEIGADTKQLKGLLSELNKMEFASSLSSTLFPMLPTPTRVARAWNAFSMYKRLKNSIQNRRAGSLKKKDGLQAMIDQNFTDKDAIITLIGSYVVSMLNTDVVLSWTLIHLFAQQQYLVKVKEEISAFMSENSTIFSSPSGLPPTLLSTIEDPKTFPMLDASLQEAIRIRSASIAIFRRNVSPDAVDVDGVKVPPNAFVVYPLGDAHYENGVWGNTDVSEFDPERVVMGKQKDGNGQLNADFLGFGAGLHVCSGRRIARLLMKLCAVYILSQYDISLKDRDGSPISMVPSTTPSLFKLSLPDEGEEVTLSFRRKA